MKIRKILSDFFSYFPEGGIKDRIRIFLYNRPKNQEFSIFKEKKLWIAKYPDFRLVFSKESIPYHVLLSNYIFLHHLPEDQIDLMVDAGAFIGSFSIYAILKYPQIKKVLSLEPDPLNFERLKQNKELNKLSKIETLPVGLWSNKETLKFFPNQELASSVFGKGVRNDPGIEIKVDKLDNLLKGVTGKRVFIKMNIEGAELEALKGCKDVIHNNKVHLAIASDHFIDGELTYKRVQRICQEMNLSVTTFMHEPYITVYASNEVQYDNRLTN
jgi:FkbM family methyltransferase